MAWAPATNSIESLWRPRRVAQGLERGAAELGSEVGARFSTFGGSARLPLELAHLRGDVGIVGHYFSASPDSVVSPSSLLGAECDCVSLRRSWLPTQSGSFETLDLKSHKRFSQHPNRLLCLAPIRSAIEILWWVTRCDVVELPFCGSRNPS